MIVLPYGEKNCDDMLSRFHLIPERNGQTDGRTDAQTDIFAISISRVSMLTRDKNQPNHTKINTSNTEETPFLSAHRDCFSRSLLSDFCTL